MKITYAKYFKINDILDKEELFLPKEENELNIYYSDKNTQEIDIPHKDIKFFYNFWHNELCGDCYGNEMPLLHAFKIFFDNLIDDTYNYAKLSKLYNNEGLCWSIIIHLEKLNLIEWGTSIRFGFLNNYIWKNKEYIYSDKAKTLKDIFQKYNLNVLYQIVNLQKEYDNNKNIEIFTQIIK